MRASWHWLLTGSAAEYRRKILSLARQPESSLSILRLVLGVLTRTAISIAMLACFSKHYQHRAERIPKARRLRKSRKATRETAESGVRSVFGEQQPALVDTGRDCGDAWVVTNH